MIPLQSNINAHQAFLLVDVALGYKAFGPQLVSAPPCLEGVLIMLIDNPHVLTHNVIMISTLQRDLISKRKEISQPRETHNG